MSESKKIETEVIKNTSESNIVIFTRYINSDFWILQVGDWRDDGAWDDKSDWRDDAS